METVEMHGRLVRIRQLELDERKVCPDCGNIARLEVTELEATKNPSVWYWCGWCDIGG